MKEIICWTILLLTGFLREGRAQTYFRIDADSVRIINGELILQNQTRNIQGTLINIGSGVTTFQKLKLANIGDSAMAILGQDTLNMNDNNAVGSYYVLSKNIPLQPGYYYHPLAFESALDSGITYHVHALFYFETTFAFDQSSLFRINYSDTVYRERAQLRNTIETANGLKKYSLEYDKVIRSKYHDDTLKLSFYTGLEDVSGRMKLDSLSYMNVEQFTPAKYSN